MRGKKIDSEFLSLFITESVESGLNSPDAIANRAKILIDGIDEEIKEVERKKIIRSKLLDVIATFQYVEKNNKVKEIKLLSFFKIQNTDDICRQICIFIKNTNVSFEDLREKFESKTNFIFSIKQLLEAKVISKVGTLLSRGEMFEEYMKFILRET